MTELTDRQRRTAEEWFDETLEHIRINRPKLATRIDGRGNIVLHRAIWQSCIAEAYQPGGLRISDSTVNRRLRRMVAAGILRESICYDMEVTDEYRARAYKALGLDEGNSDG